MSAKPERATYMADFLSAKKEQNLSPKSIQFYDLNIRNFEEYLQSDDIEGRDLEYSELVRKDITGYLRYLREKRKFAPYTRKQALRVLKQFLRFAITGKLSGAMPACVEGIKVSVPKKDLTNQRITEEEFGRILDETAHCPWFQAFLAVAYDTGCRRSEIRKCKVKNFKTDKYGGLLQVRGKTGERTVRLAYSYRFVVDQINRLPEDEEGWLFPSRSNPKRCISGSLLIHKLTIVRKKLGYKPNERGRWPINIHTFRHNRATIVAEKGWNEQMMRDHFGWSKGSDMPSHYTHVNRGALDAAIFKSQGMSNLIVPEEEEFGIETTWECRMCRGFNPMHHNFCGTCGQARSRGVAMTYDNILETIEKKVAGQMAEKALNEILADKELQELGNALQPDEALKEELGLT